MLSDDAVAEFMILCADRLGLQLSPGQVEEAQSRLLALYEAIASAHSERQWTHHEEEFQGWLVGSWGPAPSIRSLP